MSKEHLSTYLNDHLAGSVSALELIAHWADVHKDEPLGSFFAEIESEIKADQNTLRDVMRALGIAESKVRKAGAWAAEKVGRDHECCQRGLELHCQTPELKNCNGGN